MMKIYLDYLVREKFLNKPMNMHSFFEQNQNNELPVVVEKKQQGFIDSSKESGSEVYKKEQKM